MDEKLTPNEWAKQEGIVIVDPDGWRHDGKSICEPIHHAEWERRRDVSTIAHRNPDGSW